MKTALLFAAATCAATGALAASRGHYGGVLRVAVAARPPDADPSLADAPAEAAVLALTSTPVCRLDAAHRPVAILASQMGWQESQRLKIELRSDLALAKGAALSAADVFASWSRLSDSASPSPYRALLFALREDALRPSPSLQRIELSLAFPWPDLLSSLCHPALAIRGSSGSRPGVGPFFASSATTVHASLSFPVGRPFADAVALAFVDGRGAARRLALGQAHLALGGINAKGPASNGPVLYATYLAYRPERAGGDLRQAFEAAIERGELTRFFVPTPSEPMNALLPPALMTQAAPAHPPAPAAASGRALTLLYDESLPEQRLVAQRLQVKMHDRKYVLALQPLPRAALRAAWASGRFDLMLHSVLLPPSPAAALALALEIAGRHDLLASELPPIGALPSEAERAEAAVERARALLPSLSLIPLYAQGLSGAKSERLASFAFDGSGLPALDDAFLLPE